MQLQWTAQPVHIYPYLYEYMIPQHAFSPTATPPHSLHHRLYSPRLRFDKGRGE